MPLITDQYGRFPDHHDMYRMLGLNPNRHLPKEGFDECTLQGVRFRCLPATGLGNRSTHRLQLFCPTCEYWMPFSRYPQHARGRAHKEKAGA